jgi:hypothetical protein
MPTLHEGRPHGTRAEFAAHIQRSPPYVTKLGHQGRLVERMVGGKKLVDFELSIRLIRNTEDMGRARNGQNARGGPAARHDDDTAADQDPAADPPPRTYGAGPQPSPPNDPGGGIVGGFSDSHRTDRLYRQAQAQQRVYEAKLAELEYRQRIGKLVLVDDVRAEHARLLAMIRETFQQLPLRVVPLLAAQPEPASMDSILRREIATALTSIAQAD